VKAVILAGGLGSRLAEETVARPKPMVEVGGMPLLWHIMKLYSSHGINDFVICLGYKGYMIKEYFANYYLHTSDVTFDIASNDMEVHQTTAEPWRVTLVDTGKDTQTGGRLRRALPYVGEEEFCFTYGDGLSDVDLSAVVEHHRGQGTVATVTAVQPPGRWGALDVSENLIRGFSEKPEGDGGWINAGFFVLSPAVADYIAGDDTVWERDPLERLAREGQLSAYKHGGFWHAMDTMRDRDVLERHWQSGAAPWKTWV
jgi:glucose-1-phosphate cytidylyltransferase